MANVIPFRSKRFLSAYVDVAFGFDGETIFAPTPVPREVKIRRQIRMLNVALDYPLGARSRASISVPLVSQTTKVRDSLGSFTQRGNGLGDIAAQVEHRLKESKNGVEPSVALGMIFPTGRDPFNLGLLDLPTGNGFYQPYARASIRKLRVPLQLYASLNVGKAFARTVNGQRLNLPTTYGGEVGFLYSLGPEFTTGTSLSASRLSSPFLLDTGVNVAYLTQSLNYNTGGDTSLRASVDVGLTEESTDAYLNLSLRHGF